MLPFFLKVSIYIDFKINQDFIAKVLCIKKDVPNNGCQGNCHLKKQLSKTEEIPASEELPNNLITKLKVEAVFTDKEKKSVIEAKLIKKQFEFPSFYIEPNIIGLDHPPKFVA